MAREVGAAKYLECSAKMLEGVKDVFDQVSMQILRDYLR
jgi:hypothetical protein